MIPLGSKHRSNNVLDLVRHSGFAAGGGQQATALWLQENLDLDIKLVSYDGGSDASAQESYTLASLSI